MVLLWMMRNQWCSHVWVSDVPAGFRMLILARSRFLIGWCHHASSSTSVRWAPAKSLKRKFGEGCSSSIRHYINSDFDLPLFRKHLFWFITLICILMMHWMRILYCGRVLRWSFWRNSKTVWGNKWCRKATFWRSFASIAFLIYIDFKIMNISLRKLISCSKKVLMLLHMPILCALFFMLSQITFWACMSALYFLSSVFLLMIFFISSLNVEDNIVGMVLQQLSL